MSPPGSLADLHEPLRGIIIYSMMGVHYRAIERFHIAGKLSYDNVIVVTLAARRGHLPHAEIAGEVRSPGGVRMPGGWLPVAKMGNGPGS